MSTAWPAGVALSFLVLSSAARAGEAGGAADQPSQAAQSNRARQSDERKSDMGETPGERRRAAAGWPHLPSYPDARARAARISEANAPWSPLGLIRTRAGAARLSPLGNGRGTHRRRSSRGPGHAREAMSGVGRRRGLSPIQAR